MINILRVKRLLIFTMNVRRGKKMFVCKNVNLGGLLIIFIMIDNLRVRIFKNK